MEIIVLFLPKPSLLAWSVAIPKVEIKFGFNASCGALSVTALTKGTPSRSVIKIQCNPLTLQ